MGLLEKILYSFERNFSVYDVEKNLSLLAETIPPEFKGRGVTDIGCGDGKTSLMIKDILEPEEFEGVDVSEALVRSARGRGLDARVVNVEEENLSGDLAVLWGVLHHFEDPWEVFGRLADSFKSFIIREPTNGNRIFEAGHRFDENDVMDVVLSAVDEDDLFVARPDDGDFIILYIDTS